MRRNNRARHEHPREIDFLEDFPLTTTGKIKRTKPRLRNLNRRDPV